MDRLHIFDPLAIGNLLVVEKNEGDKILAGSNIFCGHCGHIWATVENDIILSESGLQKFTANLNLHNVRKVNFIRFIHEQYGCGAKIQLINSMFITVNQFMDYQKAKMGLFNQLKSIGQD